MTARLVAVGQKKAPYPTLYTQYAIKDPEWSACQNHAGETTELDHDLLRKQRIEEELAWGDDL